MNPRFRELKTRLAEIQDLRAARHMLSWDQQTMMPPRGASGRAEQLATLERLAHERVTSVELTRLLAELRADEERLDYDSDEASLIRVARRDHEKARRVPDDLRAEMTRAEALALPVWLEARAKSDFSLFLPALRTNLDLTHRYVDCFDGGDEEYDVLLDDYEQGMKVAEVRTVFERLKEELLPLIAGIADTDVDDSCLRGHFPEARQKELALTVIRGFGFDAEAWRLDVSAHPFATGSSVDDIRLTTRYDEQELSSSLFGAMHECGHGLYEAGIDRALERTPLCRGASMGLHESQSRMWENLVGRSAQLWHHFYPELRRIFPEQFSDVGEEAFHRAVNKVEPSLIRVEADELTYNLHIILRFELEQELLAGEVGLGELPEAWNARMKDYLGIDVPDDTHGVLQDIHWSGGSFGYFPTYALGNVISVQIWERALVDVPDLLEQFERGEFLGLREWLRVHLHRHGRKFTPRETLERVVGGPIDPEPYLRYLKGKLGEIYGVAA